MALEVDGKTIETTENGHLVNAEDWTEAVAEAIAATDKLEMTEQHWDVVKYLRDEHYNNAGNHTDNYCASRQNIGTPCSDAYKACECSI